MHIMDNLSDEGRAIYDSLTAMAAEKREQHKQEVSSLISQSINTAVDTAMTRTIAYVSKTNAEMQVYADGIESTVNRNFETLR
jgi:hypothetical protein